MYFLSENMCFLENVSIFDYFFGQTGASGAVFIVHHDDVKRLPLFFRNGETSPPHVSCFRAGWRLPVDPALPRQQKKQRQKNG